MIDNIKLMLGDYASNFTDAQITLAYNISIDEIENYCGRKCDGTLLFTAQKMAVIKLNRQGTEGLASQSYSGVSESYIDGYPQDIQNVLNRKRKIKTL